MDKQTMEYHLQPSDLHLHNTTSKMDTVPKQREHNEVYGGPHSCLHTALGANPVVHHLVPVLPSKYLDEQKHIPAR